MAYLGLDEGADPRPFRPHLAAQEPAPAYVEPIPAPAAPAPPQLPNPYGGRTQAKPRTAPPVPPTLPPPNPYQRPAINPATSPYGSGGQGPPGYTGGWGDYNPYYQGDIDQGAGNVYQPGPMGSNYQYGGNVQGTPYGAGPGGYNTSHLEGFDQGKLNDPTHNSAKYMFARVASRYAPTQAGFAQLMADPDFQRLGMQSLGNGRIRLSNGDVIDVVRGYQSGGQAWQWSPEDATPAAPPQQPPAPYNPYSAPYNPYGAYQPPPYAPAPTGPAYSPPPVASPPVDNWGGGGATVQAPWQGADPYAQAWASEPSYNQGYNLQPPTRGQYNAGYAPLPAQGHPYSQAFQYMGQGLWPPMNYPGW